MRQLLRLLPQSIAWPWSALLLLASTGTVQAQQAAFTLQPNAPYTGDDVRPLEVVLGDVNNDGKPDALIANEDIETFGMLFGDGKGGFITQPNEPHSDFGTGSGPNSLAVADLNGDGKLDIVAVNSLGCDLVTLLGNGVGGFTLHPYPPSTGISSNPTRVVLADVNRDGHLDALTTQHNTGTLGVLLGDGQGGFTVQPKSLTTFIGGGPQDVAVVDVNGDGLLDALMTNLTRTLDVLLGDGKGNFTLQPNSPSTGNAADVSGLATADVNGDGHLDALIVSYEEHLLSVLLGDGKGGFTLQPNPVSTGEQTTPTHLVITDINGDGRLDALTVSYFNSTLDVLLGDSKGNFILQPNSPSTGARTGPRGLVVTDVNGDGQPDVMTANWYSRTVSVLLNTTTLLPTRPALADSRAQLYPNPTAGPATLVYYLNAPASVSAEVLDGLGRLMLTLVRDQRQVAGPQTLAVPALPAGLYTVRLLHDGVSEFRKLAVE